MRNLATVLLCLAAPAMAAKQTFTDVPRGHWAYPAIQKLVHSGMIQGKKGAFEGTKAFTRYEMAVVLARYMEKLSVAKEGLQGTIEKTYPLLKKLATEFSAELDLLGVKHQDLLARVTSLETRMDMHHGELQELRALVEENRRMLLAAGNHAARDVARTQAAAPMAYPPVYRQMEAPPPMAGGQASLPQAPQPSGMLFASAPDGGLQVPDAMRLQNLRLRARGLLDEAPRRPTRRGHAPRSAAPARRDGPGLQLGSAPTQWAPRPELGNSQQQQILDAMDRVRSGELDLAAAEAYGAEIEAELDRRRSMRTPSQVYPLSERLFGPSGLGPPAGD